MKYFLVLACLTIAKAGVLKVEDSTNKEICDGVIIDNIYHAKELIKQDLDRPYMLAVDNTSNLLYFSYSLQNNADVFTTAKVDLDDNVFTDLKILNGFAQTVDQHTHDVYIGSDDGIYKYNNKKNEAEFLGLSGSDIWSIYYNDVLYFSEFPSQFLYTFIDGEVVRFKDLEDTKVDHFIIDNENVIFFTNASGLYSQPKGTKDAVFVEEFGYYGPRGMSKDGKGDIYLCMRNGIFKIDKVEANLNKIADIDDCFGIAFDRDNNIIYADSSNIFRLKSTGNKSC